MPSMLSAFISGLIKAHNMRLVPKAWQTCLGREGSKKNQNPSLANIVSFIEIGRTNLALSENVPRGSDGAKNE